MVKVLSHGSSTDIGHCYGIPAGSVLWLCLVHVYDRRILGFLG